MFYTKDSSRGEHSELKIAKAKSTLCFFSTLEFLIHCDVFSYSVANLLVGAVFSISFEKLSALYNADITYFFHYPEFAADPYHSHMKSSYCTMSYVLTLWFLSWLACLNLGVKIYACVWHSCQKKDCKALCVLCCSTARVTRN